MPEIDHPARFASLPAPGPFEPSQVVRELGDGLVLRHASKADAEALDHFTRVVQADPPDFTPIDDLGTWSYDLANGEHPVVRPGDFWLVEDTGRRRIASSLGLISQRMRYDGIGFDAGQVELVGSHPEHRRRGLVRVQMEELHRASSARGQRLQWIAGIPNYYRQFGYDMALETDAGCVVPRSRLPDPAAGRESELRWRRAEPADAERISAILDHGARRLRVSCDTSAEFWRYEIATKSTRNQSRRDIHLLVDPSGNTIGLLMTAPRLYKGSLLVPAVELAEGATWPATSAAMLARIRELGDELAARANAPFEFTRLQLGTQHPLYEIERDRLRDRRRSYALYVRIEDLAGFLELVAPALEQRLARSEHAGRSGPLELSFYRSGLRLRFEAGRLRAVEPWQPSTEALGHHAFPEHSFLQLLLGYRSLSELQRAFADCHPWSEAHVPWIEALFPPAPSHLIPVS